MKVRQAKRLHGPMYSLMGRLSRFGWLGWLCFVGLLLTNVGYVYLDRVLPKPFAVVDKDGKLIGYADYSAPAVMTHDDYLAAGMSFVQRCLSVNSATIEMDTLLCLRMMSGDLVTQRMEMLYVNNSLAKIEKAKIRTYFEFDRNASSVKPQNDGSVIVRLVGVQKNVTTDTDLEKFDVVLTVHPVPRLQNPEGIEVVDFHNKVPDVPVISQNLR